MVEDDLILGNNTQAEIKRLDAKILFSCETKYRISTEGSNNVSIETGCLVESILPVEEKEKLINGQVELVYNGMVIKRIAENCVSKVEKAVEVPKSAPKVANKATESKKVSIKTRKGK